jgi:UDP-glucose 4-epimerase
MRDSPTPAGDHGGYGWNPLMRHLVTGGAGFIGSHVVEALLARGDRAIVLDDCSTGSMDNLLGVSGDPRLRVILGSVCDQAAVDEACAQAESVIHLAAAVGVARILDHQVDSIVTNVRGTETILRAAAARSLPTFIASSSEVYGKSLSVPFREGDDSVLGATSLHRWSYACGKALDEFLALAYWRERRVPVVIGRFFNITGPRQSPHYGMVLPRFCQAACAGEPLSVYGDGSQTRCFLHVSDCVSALLSLMRFPDAIGKVVNIGGDSEISMRLLAQLVIREARSGSSIRSVPYSEAYPQGGFEDLQRRVPDTALLRKITGWTTTHDLTSIVRACLAATPAPEPRR